MSDVLTFLDCGCAILKNGSRSWCPTCEGGGTGRRQESGFTWADVETLHRAASAVLSLKNRVSDRGAAQIGPLEDELMALADRIEALLPPRTPNV